MELIFIRHGETIFNKYRHVMGQRVDAPLDEKGIDQARAMVGKIGSNFSLIYSSPLRRAAQTAEIIADHFQKTIEYREELKERDFGSLSGKSWVDIDVIGGRPMMEIDHNLEYDYTPFGGESVVQVKNRLQKFLEEIRGKHSYENLVVVTHFGIIKLMEDMYTAKEYHALDNASIHKFEF